MTRRIRWLWSLPVCFLIALTLSPYLVGWLIERQFSAQHRHPTLPEPLHIQDIQRGWLTTQASSTLTLPDSQIRLQHQINHGPLSLTWRQPVLATVHTVLTSAECHQLNVDCDGSALILDSLLHWDGSSQHHLSIPYLQHQQLSVQTLHAQLHAPVLSQAHGAGALAAESTSTELRLQAKQWQYAWLDLANLRSTLNLTTIGPDKKLLVHSQLSADNLNWHRQGWGNVSVKLLVESLDTALLLTLLTQQPALAQLQATQHWLTQRPLITLEHLTLDHAKLTAQGFVRLRPVGLWQLLRKPSLRTLMTALLEQAELTLQVEYDLAERLLTYWQMSDFSDPAPLTARQQLAEWSQAGLVELRDNYFYARLVFKDNQYSSQNLTLSK